MSKEQNIKNTNDDNTNICKVPVQRECMNNKKIFLETAIKKNTQQ